MSAKGDISKLLPANPIESRFSSSVGNGYRVNQVGSVIHINNRGLGINGVNRQGRQS